MAVEIKKHRPIVYRYYDYLKKHHLGAENGISRNELCKIFNINLQTQKTILREINQGTDFDKLVSTSNSIYMCKRKSECQLAIHNELVSALTRLNKAKAMADKLDKQGQFKMSFGQYYKDFITVYEDKGEQL